MRLLHGEKEQVSDSKGQGLWVTPRLLHGEKEQVSGSGTAEGPESRIDTFERAAAGRRLGPLARVGMIARVVDKTFTKSR